jgi:glutamyl-tRNA synthetase
LRVHVPTDTTISINGVDLHLDLELGDFVIWRRDDLPAYQLVSVVEDRDLGTTHIVRGEDLLASTAAQIFIASSLGADNLVTAHYVHHPLLTDVSGAKLSKSRQNGNPSHT